MLQLFGMPCDLVYLVRTNYPNRIEKIVSSIMYGQMIEAVQFTCFLCFVLVAPRLPHA